MAKRVYFETIKKWAIRLGLTGGSLIGLLFMYLIAIGAISNVSYSGDSICAGTLEDPCYAFINFTANEDIFIYPTNYDPWGRDTLFNFDPNIKSWKLERSWGEGWRNIPLNTTCTGTWCGAPNNKGCAYSIAFREGRDYRIRIVALKNNPKDTIKWGAFSGVDEIDPTWFGINGAITINDRRKVFNGNYKVLSQTNNETLYDVEFEKTEIERINQSNRTDTIICAKANFSEKEVVTYKLEEKTEKEVVDKIYTYSVPEKLSFYKNTSLSKQPDIERSLTKSNVLSLTQDKFEEGDEYEFCYQANPEEDFYLKLGDNSIVIIQDSDWISTSTLTNVTAESGASNHTHLNVSNTAPWDSLVGYWSADGDLENDGSWVTGQVGNSLDFDGDVNYVSVPYDTSLNITGNLTISAWVKGSLSISGDDVIIGITTDTDDITDTQYALFVSTDEQVNFIYKGIDLDSGISVKDDTWHHFVAVANDTDVSLYADNVLKDSDALGSINPETYDISIGAEFDGAALFLGLIDEVRIWNRSLNTTEIANIFNNETAGQTDQNMDRTGLVGEWTFNETSGKIASDSSGEANNGKVAVDETAYDWSGEGNDGTMYGNAVSTAGGRYGKGFEFDGVGDYVNAGSFEASEGVAELTISLWVYPLSSEGSYQTFISKASDKHFYFRWAGDEDIEFRVYNDTSTYYSTAQYSDGIPIGGNNKWYHMVGVYNGTNTMVYVNGVIGGSIASLTGTVSSSTSDLHIGSYRGNQRYWNGTIDDVMIFSTALNSTQILEIYNNQSARFLETGTQDITNQSYMNISTGNNRVNVSTQIQELMGSDINLTVGYYNGSWLATAPQTISSLTNYTFVIDDASTNLTLNYTFIAGNDTTSFYTPLILGDVTFEAWSSAVADTTSPTWSLNQTNSTINGSSTLFSLYWDDDTALEDLGQYIFSTNNTGIWANESAVNFTSTPEWANVTLTLNDTVGISIGWRMYVDDNAGNVNNTGVFSLTTTSAVADTCTCPGAGNSWEIDMEDYCNLTESCNLTTGNVTWIGSSGYFNCSAEFKLTNRDAPPSATIFYFSSGCNLIHLIIGLMFFIKRRKYEIGTI